MHVFGRDGRTQNWLSIFVQDCGVKRYGDCFVTEGRSIRALSASARAHCANRPLPCERCSRVPLRCVDVGIPAPRAHPHRHFCNMQSLDLDFGVGDDDTSADPSAVDSATGADTQDGSNSQAVDTGNDAASSAPSTTHRSEVPPMSALATKYCIGCGCNAATPSPLCQSMSRTWDHSAASGADTARMSGSEVPRLRLHCVASASRDMGGTFGR